METAGESCRASGLSVVGGVRSFVPTALWRSYAVDPALKCWAIFISCLRHGTNEPVVSGIL